METKVAHFISTSGLYGAERWILGLLKHIKVDSILICTNHDNQDIIKEAKKLKIKTKVLNSTGNYAVKDSARKLAEYIKKENISILHTHGYKSDLIGLLAKKKANIKIISTPHGWSKNVCLKLRIYEIMDKLILRSFDLVAPVSKGITDSLKHIENIKTINNFVDLKTIPKTKKGNPKLITYIGQLIERKRIQDLIKAIKILNNKEIKLQIIGEGDKRQELEILSKKLKLNNQIKFLGFRKDRLKLLNNSTTLILSSLLEGIPRVAMEAMAMQKIVIATDIEGNKDIIKHKETGLLVRKKQPKDIAKAIQYTLENQKQSEKITKKAKSLIEKKFSAERAAKEYKKIYEELI